MSAISIKQDTKNGQCMKITLDETMTEILRVLAKVNPEIRAAYLEKALWLVGNVEPDVLYKQKNT